MKTLRQITRAEYSQKQNNCWKTCHVHDVGVESSESLLRYVEEPRPECSSWNFSEAFEIKGGQGQEGQQQLDQNSEKVVLVVNLTPLRLSFSSTVHRIVSGRVLVVHFESCELLYKVMQPTADSFVQERRQSKSEREGLDRREQRRVGIRSKLLLGNVTPLSPLSSFGMKGDYWRRQAIAKGRKRFGHS